MPQTVNSNNMAEVPKIKSKAQKLRGVLYILWMQTEPGIEFEEYYAMQMDKIIDYLKGKLKD